MKKGLNLPTFLLVSLLIRILMFGCSIGESIIMIAFSALYAGHQYLESNKEKPVNTDIKNRIVELEEQQKILKDKLNSVSLGISLRK